jgi:hypothetical protein
MANIKFTPEQWDNAREYFEAGLSLSEIEGKTGIERSRISKVAKAKAWSKSNSQKQRLIQQAVQVAEAKATLPPLAVRVHNELVEERTGHLPQLFRAGMFAVSAGAEILKSDRTMQNAVGLSVAVKNVAGVIEPKTPATAVQINNTQTLQAMTEQEIREKAERYGFTI